MNNGTIRFGIYGLAVLALCSCGAGSEKNERTAQVEQQLPVVSVVKAEVRSVPQDEDYSSTVQAFAINNIAPQGTGRIEKILVDVGSFVNQGQVLAEMEDVNLIQAKLKLANDAAELERLRSLYNEGGVSQSDFESMELAYKVSKSTYDNLEKNTILRSPINGVVTVRNYDRGDLYSMGQPIFVVQQITPVKLLVGVSEKDYTRVKNGQEVTIKADALPGESFIGKVAKVYPVADAMTHTFNVEVRVQNNSHRLRPGMYAKVNIMFGRNNSVVVPDNAVIKQQGSGQRSVYVLEKDNTVTMKIVTLGRHIGNEFEILSGIEPDETVVVKGQTALKSGIKVEVAR